MACGNKPNTITRERWIRSRRILYRLAPNTADYVYFPIYGSRRELRYCPHDQRFELFFPGGCLVEWCLCPVVDRHQFESDFLTRAGLFAYERRNCDGSGPERRQYVFQLRYLHHYIAEHACGNCGPFPTGDCRVSLLTGYQKAEPRASSRPFSGVEVCSQRGPDYLRQFLRLRADLAPPSPVPQYGDGAKVQATTTVPPPPGFNLRPTLPAGFLPTAVATGDFNGDGHIDWAVANGGDNNMWIYLGKGDGTSQIPTIVPLKGASPSALVVADMNKDGKLDLVVAEPDTGTVGILLGNGDGTFGPELEFYVPGGAASLAVADFNGDGNLDVVVGMVGDQSTGQLVFLPGDGTGKLGLPVIHFGQIKSGLFDTFIIAAADLNGDGLPDIVALDYNIEPVGPPYAFSGQMSNAGGRVYLNQGNGVFKEYQQFFFDISDDQEASLGTAAVALALGDVNGDGCMDAVVLDTEDLATFFPGKCDGAFDTANTRIFGSGITAGAALLVDVNGDGKLDLVSAAFPFTTDADYAMNLGNAVSVQLGDGTGNFSPPTIFRGEPEMYSIAAADLTGAGYPDLVSVNQGTDSLSVYLNNGSGGFGGPSGGYLGYLTSGQANGVFDAPFSNFMYADVNNDGYSDLVLLDFGAQYPVPYALSVQLANGTGGFGPPIRSPILDIGVNQNIWDYTLADFRGTGLPDLLLLTWQGTPSHSNATPYIVYSKNNGDGTFEKPVLTPLTSFSPGSFVVGDFNNDGKLDLLLSYVACGQSGICQTPALMPFLGNGDGTFRQGTPVTFNTTSAANITGILTADMNSDGTLDLLVSGNALMSANDANSMYELIGNGDGTFQAPKLVFSNPGSTSYFATADLNKDGIPDLVEEAVNNETSGNGFPRTFRTYLGQSGGSFQLTGTYGPFPNNYSSALLFGAPSKPVWPLEPSLGDFNGDGNLDIAVYEQGAGGSLAPLPIYWRSWPETATARLRLRTWFLVWATCSPRHSSPTSTATFGPTSSNSTDTPLPTTL